MPSLAKLLQLRSVSDASAGERFARALVTLTRTVWQPDCDFDTAIASICKVAAAALQVERVSVWQYDVEAHMLRCVHAWRASDGSGGQAADRETLSLDGDDYMSALRDVRTLNADDFDIDLDVTPSHRQLSEYLKRHRIHALLDAPACVDGKLWGVISHESIDRQRVWSDEEATFAASMGDFVAMAHEVALRRSAENEVLHLQLHDAATGLPNGEYLEERLRQRLTGPRQRGDVPAIVHVRIDVAAGGVLSASAPTEAEVMVQVAKQLAQVDAGSADLARLHSNGFAFLLAPRAHQGNAVELAERCLAAVRGLERSHEEIHPGAAVGIAFALSDIGGDARKLLRQAEEAADRAHLIDRFAWEVFDLGHHDALVERLRVERALRRALAHGDFELHYQPEYDAESHTWVAAEALLRWREGGRLLSAAEFIGVAEASGLILPLGSWVLHRACRDAATWAASSNGAYAVLRVNVSARQFEAPGLAQDVAAALQASGLPPERLCLELTETTLMGNIERACEVLENIRATGVTIAIDDFGTGFASLVYLKRLPIDALKIDRSFVIGLPADPVDSAIVAALAGLAGTLGIEVIAEGVEQLAQQHALQSIGVRRMQGWLYARAMDQEQMCRLLASPVDAHWRAKDGPQLGDLVAVRM